MQSLTFIYEPGERRAHLGLVLLLVSAAVVVAWLIRLDSLGLTPAEWRLAALPLSVPVIASYWIFFQIPPPKVTDCLRIDAEGLSCNRGGRKHAWRWSEISDVRSFGYLHPAVLICGPAIAFRAPGGSGQSGPLSPIYRILFLGRNVVIWGHHISGPDVIMRWIDRYRTLASGHAPPARSVRPPQPAIYYRRRKPGKLQSPAGIAMVTIFGGLVGVAVFAGLAIVMSGSWPSDWASVKALYSESALLRSTITFVPGLIFVSTLTTTRQMSRGCNLLLLSSDGLHTRFNGIHRRWLWSEITQPELRRMERAGVGDEHCETIGFVASHDGKRPGKEPVGGPLPGAVSEAIEDAYDAPLAEIARHAQAWHATAAADRMPAVMPEPAAHATAPPAAEAEALSFRRRWAPAQSIFATLTIVVMWIFMIGGAVAAIFTQDPAISGNAKLGLILAGFLFGMAAPFFLVFMMAGGDNNMLRLDSDGLTYVRLGRIAGWSWRDLSAFELRAGSSRWSKTKVPLITATLRSGDDRLSRLMRWAYAIAAPRPVTVIEDVYDTPPGEILRRLNEYRERALHIGTD